MGAPSQLYPRNPQRDSMSHRSSQWSQQRRDETELSRPLYPPSVLSQQHSQCDTQFKADLNLHHHIPSQGRIAGGRSSSSHSYLQPTTAHATTSAAKAVVHTLSSPLIRSSSGPQPQFKAHNSQPFSRGPAFRSISGSDKSNNVSRIAELFEPRHTQQNSRPMQRLGHSGNPSLPYSSTLAAAMGQLNTLKPAQTSFSQRQVHAPLQQQSPPQHIASSGSVQPEVGPCPILSNAPPSRAKADKKSRPVTRPSERSGTSSLSVAVDVTRLDSTSFVSPSWSNRSEVANGAPTLRVSSAADRQSSPHRADRSQRGQTPRETNEAAEGRLASIGLTTPTAFSESSGAFVSPSSIRSGPESPDPLNVISPLRHSSARRQGSPIELWARDQREDSSSSGPLPLHTGLNAAMGSSMRATLGGASKRHLDSGAVAEWSNATQKRKKSNSGNKNGPSPVKAMTFYADNLAEPSTDSSHLALPLLPPFEDGPVASAVPVATKKAPKASGRPSKSKNKSAARQRPASTVEKNGISTTTSSPEPSSVAGSTQPQRRQAVSPKRVGGRSGSSTTFTSRLRLALPIDSDSDSGSAEEWDKSSDYEMHSIDNKAAGCLAHDGDILQTPSQVVESTTITAARTKGSIVKSAERRSPMKRLLDYLEDLFEAEGSIPSQDDLAGSGSEDLSVPASDFFVLLDGIAVLKPSRIQHLSKLVRACASSRGKHRIMHTLSVASGGERSAAVEPGTLAEIDAQEMQRLLRILAVVVKIGEGINPFPATESSRDDKSRSPTKKGAAETSASARRRLKTKADDQHKEDDVEDDDGKNEQQEEENEDEGELEGQESEKDSDEEHDLGKDKSPSAAGSPKRQGPKAVSKESTGPSRTKTSDIGPSGNRQVTEEQSKQLGEDLTRIAASLMGIDCCLAIIAQLDMDKSLPSEDLLKPCFDTIRSSLEQVIFPYIEACSTVGVAAPHPFLDAWISAIAPGSTVKLPKKSRGRPKKVIVEAAHDESNVEADPTGVYASCTESLKSIIRSNVSSMLQAQKLIVLPSISLSETILFSAVYASLGPFFAIDPDFPSGNTEAAKAGARGRKALEALAAPGFEQSVTVMKSIRLPALTLLCIIFSRYPEQRQWIIEEVLNSLSRLPDIKKNHRQYTLRNGKAITSITALLIQLTQAASYGLKDRFLPNNGSATSSDGAALQIGLAASWRGEGQAAAEGGEEGEAAPAATGSTQSDYDLSSLRRALDGPAQTSRAIAAFLMSKISGQKVTKSSGDFTYASIVEILIEDLLTTVYLPDWPASILLLSSICRSFGSILEDAKVLPDAKGIALEHLGNVAAHLRASQLKVDASRTIPASHVAQRSTRPAPRTINAIEQAKDEEGLKHLSLAYTTILDHLASAEIDDHTSQSAREFLMAQWGSEVSASLVRTSAALDLARGSEDEQDQQLITQISVYLAGLHRSLLLLSRNGGLANTSSHCIPGDDVFSSLPLSSYEEAAVICEQLVQTTSYSVTFDFARSALVGALDGQAVGNRTRAIRGLKTIYAADPSLLNVATIRDAIETRLSDESIGVREAAVGLLSKYLLGEPEDLQMMYKKLRERIFDAGLAVRKRTLKLLANIYRTLPSDEMKIDACVRMVRCVNDEDVGIQDLAVQTLGEIWLNFRSGDSHTSGSTKNINVEECEVDEARVPRQAVSDSSESDQQCSLISDMRIIVAVAGAIREKPSPLEEVFTRFRKDRSAEDAQKLVIKLQALSDSLIASLDEEDDTGSADPSLLTKIKAISLVVSTNPAVLSIAKAKTLLPQLRGCPQTADEAAVLETLLKIFRVSLPVMPKTALAFANQLEAALRPLLNNPPRHMSALQEVVACYTTVIHSHTESYTVLIRTFGVLLKALGSIAAKLTSEPGSPVDRKSRMIMSETALLCEHANFDAIRIQKPELRGNIDAALGTDATKDIVFQLLLAIRMSPAYRSHALQDIGSLFRGFPLLMIDDRGMEVMDAAFASEHDLEKEMLLRIMLDFLTTDSAKRAPGTTSADPEATASTSGIPNPGYVAGRRSRGATSISNKVDMSELVGNTDNFADSGVSSILVQRYLEPILKAALCMNSQGIQRPAIDILKFIVLQGLSHPLQCMPTLISLETTNDSKISKRALQLHEHLASKHGSILAARYADFIKSSFEFQLTFHQSSAAQQDLRGYRIDPVTGVANALLHSWYTLLRDKRQTRLDFVRAMSKLLDLDTTSTDECTVERVLLSRYIADNLAVLDYKTTEEVLLVIADLKKILSVSAAQVKYLSEEYVANAEQGGNDMDVDVDDQSDRDVSQAISEDLEDSDDENADHDAQRRRRRRSRGGSRRSSVTKAGPLAVARMSIVMGTALLLRNHLKVAYGLSEGRCSKYDRKKKQSSGADRPALRKGFGGHAEPLSFDGLPLALDVISSKKLALQQMANFEDLMDDEGTMGEMDEDWEE